MAKISFVKGFSPLSVAPRANLMQALTEAGIPVGSSCGGEGICSKCVLQILSGGENLSEKNALEKELTERFEFSSTQRVSCQTQVLGDIVIDAPYW